METGPALKTRVLSSHTPDWRAALQITFLPPSLHIAAFCGFLPFFSSVNVCRNHIVSFPPKPGGIIFIQFTAAG